MGQTISSTRTLKAKTYILLFLMMALGSVGNTILDKGMKDLGPIDFSTRSAIWQGAFHTFTSGTIWLGICCMLLFMVCHMLVLSWADYSFVQPASSFSYGVVALLGHFALGEVITPLRWAGILVICCGVLIVGHTPPRTTQDTAESSMQPTTLERS